MLTVETAHLQIVMHALLCQVIQLQLAQESLWCVKAPALALQVVQPQKLVQHLLWGLECEVCEPVTLDHAPQGDHCPCTLAEDKLGAVVDAEYIFCGAFRRNPFQAKPVSCISACSSVCR